MAIIIPPLEIDLSYYKKIHPEFIHCPDEALIEHCKTFAIPHGYSTCAYDRREQLQPMLQKEIDTRHLKALEISPWHSPFLSGDNVKYFGMKDYEGLKKDAIAMKLPIEKIPRTIHFISPTADLGVVDETFDIVFSSHVIEHTPNLVKHLNDVEKILNKGGLYVLMIPDKRYCFDHYKPESTIIDVMDAFFNERKNGRLIDRLFQIKDTHNDPISHWLGYHNKLYKPKDNTEFGKLTREKFIYMFESYKELIKKGAYVDVHHWRFTPDSFRDIVNQLNDMKFINLPLYRLYHTLWGRLEFIAMLEKI